MEMANVRQRFSQNVAGNIAGRDNAKLKQRANLLNTFDVQQEGDRIRVVDEDGSTYTGKLEQLAQTDSRSLRKRRTKTWRRVGRGDAQRSESNEYYFPCGRLQQHFEKKRRPRSELHRHTGGQ